MLVKTFGSAIYGVEAITITVEVNVTEGLHTFVVGLAGSAVKESIQRVESALKSNGYHMPRTKLVVNLAPADIRKSGSAFDLPIALGVLAASGQLTNAPLLKEYMIIGELGLDGSIQPVKGALPMAIRAQEEKFKGIIVPRQNAQEAAIAGDPPVFAFSHIREVAAFFNDCAKGHPPTRFEVEEEFLFHPVSDLDFADVKGQENIKRALEIAAAGGHNIILVGPPGSGKTMLAKRFASILPPLSLAEALETTKIYSVAGKLSEHTRLVTQRPFRSPHHTVSDSGLIGGGSIPQPGEISLAHNGVLFLDELPEFKRNVLEMMRQPLEEKKVTISRAKISVDFPSGFLLLAAMNPCPCGYHNHPGRECTCPPGTVLKYLNKISGPLLDRIDLHVEVVPVPYAELTAGGNAESSATIRQRVIKARKIQSRRFGLAINKSPKKMSAGSSGVHCNARMNSRQIVKACTVDAMGARLLRMAMDNLQLSARAHDHILKIARTIADLASSNVILPIHLSEAIQYRSLDRKGWAG